MKTYLLAGAAALALGVASADDETGDRADAHAPLGVMGDHTHDAGEFMFSYRFMRMGMEGSRIGTDSVSPLEIAQTVANPFGPMPPTLRVVPEDMTMDMHMFGAMWAPNDRVTFMAMANYLVKEMDHVTYAGMVPPGSLTDANVLGRFTTKSEGFGDTKVSALVELKDDEGFQSHVTLGVSVPTGSIDETDDVLSPMNTTPTLTLPYPMQLGSGTFDPIAGITVRGRRGDVGWGVQGTAVLRLYDNDEDYRLGNEFHATAWTSYLFDPSFSVSARAEARSIGDIDGMDARIAAPVQTANPAFQGGERLDLGVGANWVGQTGALRGHRFAAEVMFPVYQDLNGPQLETDMVFALGWQKAF